MLAFLINLTHWTVILFVLTGWLSPWNTLVWTHVLFIPLMILHWRTNENRCLLTELEAKYKEPQPALATGESLEAEEEEGFIKSAWARAYGRAPSDSDLAVIIYVVLALVWTLSVYRLLAAELRT